MFLFLLFIYTIWFSDFFFFFSFFPYTYTPFLFYLCLGLFTSLILILILIIILSLFIIIIIIIIHISLTSLYGFVRRNIPDDWFCFFFAFLCVVARSFFFLILHPDSFFLSFVFLHQWLHFFLLCLTYVYNDIYIYIYYYPSLFNLYIYSDAISFGVNFV